MAADNINIEIETPVPENINIDVSTARAVWSAIVGSLSGQTDLWSELSSKALKVDLNDITTFIQSNSSQWEETADILSLSAAVLPTINPLMIAYSVAL